MKDSKIRLSFGNLIYLSSICGSERARYLLLFFHSAVQIYEFHIFIISGAVIVCLRAVLSLIFNSTLSKRGWLVE